MRKIDIIRSLQNFFFFGNEISNNSTWTDIFLPHFFSEMAYDSILGLETGNSDRFLVLFQFLQANARRVSEFMP
jgi:hypothetical protein